MSERYNNFRQEFLKTKISESRAEIQHKKNKLTAEERINLLLDKNTFVELNAFALHDCHNFEMQKKKVYRDGIITGCGKIHGRLVYIAVQDFTAIGGSMSKIQGKKLCNVLEKAISTGKPFIQINDSGGARIQEGIQALEAYGNIFKLNTLASGVIPQFSIILGPCAGGAVYSPAITDFIFMVKNISKMFITGPDVIKQVTGEEVSFEELGGALAHNQISGNSHFYFESEQECFHNFRKLFKLLPDNNTQHSVINETEDSATKTCPELNTIIPDNPKKSFEMKNIIKHIADNNNFFEVQKLYAPNSVIGFISLNKRTVGIVANQPKVSAGSLDINSADKIARFVRFCDAFNIPLINFINVPNFLPKINQKYNNIIRHKTKILYAFSEANVPKISVIIRKAFGGAYIAMCSPAMGFDRTIAWPESEIAVMGAEGAVNIIHRKEIKFSDNPEKTRQNKIDEYKKLFANPINAASQNIVDMIIEPQYTRIELINALEMLVTKKEVRPFKKHGNIPL